MEEQQRAVEEIKKAITDQSSIREQLELLRIIGQDMTVLPSDSRFTISKCVLKFTLNPNHSKCNNTHQMEIVMVICRIRQ